jgi:8-amino-7-oxononanoate synthase
LQEVFSSAAIGRNHFGERAAIITDSNCQTRSLLKCLSDGRNAPGLVVTQSRYEPKAAWLFTGQGSQYAGMARGLYESQPVVRDSLEQFQEVLRGELEWPLLKVLFEEDALLRDTTYTQPALFALEIALARLWQSWGINPDVVVGHSVGQYAAACVAGVFSPEDGVRLIARRGRLMGALTSSGAMAAIFTDAEHVGREVTEIPQLSIAAYNGGHVVISGPTPDVQAVISRFRQRDIRCELLSTSQAFHSPLMEPILDEFEAFAQTIDFRPVQHSLIDGLTGQVVPADLVLDAHYWRRHALEPVRFSQSVETLRSLGCNLLLEIGPQPALSAMALQTWPKQQEKPQVIPSLRRGGDDAKHIGEALARLYTAGVNVDFVSLSTQQRVSLPTYPFQRQRHWLTANAKGPRPPRSTTAVAPSDAADCHLVERLKGTAPADWKALVTQHLQTELQQILCRSDRPDPHLPFSQMGIDSLMATQFYARLHETLPTQVDKSTFFRVPTIEALAELICGDTAGLSVWLDSAPRPEKVECPTANESERVPERHDWLGKSGLVHLRLQMEEAGIVNPYFRANEGVAGNEIVVGGRAYIDFSNYNYLGLSGDSRLAQAVQRAVSRHGTSVSASRIISGERPLHRDLENAIAGLLGVDAALVLVSGHATNVTVIGHLFGPGDLIIYDSLDHNSILQGIQLSRAKAIPFPHNRLDSLEAVLARTTGQFRRVLIVIEGVYSMDGDIPHLPTIVALKERYGAYLMVDEAHSLGVLGPTGRGIAEHFAMQSKVVDIWMGTLSKTLASCGGYIAGSRELVEYLKYTAPGFVFSAGITPANTAAALEACRLLVEEPWRVRKLQDNARLFLGAARENRLDTGTSGGSAVVPVIVHESQECLRLAELLFRNGINVYPIVYPAVPEDQARLRFFINALHTQDQLLRSVEVLAAEFTRRGEASNGKLQPMDLNV